MNKEREHQTILHTIKCRAVALLNLNLIVLSYINFAFIGLVKEIIALKEEGILPSLLLWFCRPCERYHLHGVLFHI